MRKDTIISGSLAGILGNIPKTIISWIYYILGYVDYTFDHIAAGYFVDTKYLETPIAVIIGFIAVYPPYNIWYSDCLDYKKILFKLHLLLLLLSGGENLSARPWHLPGLLHSMPGNGVSSPRSPLPGNQASVGRFP